MARTKIHKEKGRWRNGFQEEVSMKLRLHWWRRNNDIDYFRHLRKSIMEKDLNKDMQLEINHL